MDRTHRGAAAIAGFCLLWALIIFVVSATVYNMAGDRSLLGVEMRRHTSPKSTGLPEEHYQEMGRMIADYLMFRKPFFQYYITGEDGETVACFQPHEAEHMSDCRRLIQRAGALRWISGISALVLIGVGIVLRRRRSFSNGMLVGFASAAAVFLAALIWGFIDFGSLFTVFHKLAFTNDGWLLDTRTDMLIRLMPTSFFISMAIRLLLAVLAVAFVSFTAAMMLRMAESRSEDTEELPAAEAVHGAG